MSMAKTLPRLVDALGRSYRQEGFFGPPRLVGKNLVFIARHYYDSRFDRRYNVDTTGRIDLHLLDIKSPNKAFGIYYEPTPIGTFRKIMASVPEDFRDYTFIDYGCGKGRALLAAAEHPFRRIIGIEFSEELVAVARRNLVSYRNLWQQCSRIEVLNIDALDYELPAENCVIYLANPFGRTLMHQVMEKILRWYESCPRKLYVVYYHPQSGDVVAAQLPFLSRIKERKAVLDFASPRIRGFAIFSSIDPDTREPRRQPAGHRAEP